MNEVNRIRQKLMDHRPLILNITNRVTTDFIANGLLSLGASPIMSEANSEIEELVNLASAVVINIGTLNDEFIELVFKTCQIAHALQKPIILDPVGAGATRLRTTVSQQLLSSGSISIVRGNASEIMSLSTQCSNTKGVDSTIVDTTDAEDAAIALAKQYHVVVAVSGAIDIITDATVTQKIARGSPMMPLVTGTGCLLSAVIAAFHAIHPPAFEAAFYASYFYALCGEQAALKTASPGSFKMYFLDALHQPLE